MLTHERLLEVMNYDPETGIARWRSKPAPRANRIQIGDEMGRVTNGYKCVSIDQEFYYLHILIWFYMTGEWPKETIDHHDLNALNNAWNNLREATQQEQNANKAPRGELGLKGVIYKKDQNRSRPYVAQINKDGKNKVLGYFDCPAAASFRYQIEADKLYGKFARW